MKYEWIKVKCPYCDNIFECFIGNTKDDKPMCDKCNKAFKLTQSQKVDK